MKIKEKPKVYNTTVQIKQQLRDIFNRPNTINNQYISNDLPIVVTRRASGKTTGLVQFVGERLLQLDDENQNVAVIVPNESIGARFLREFETFFPLLNPPYVASASDQSHLLKGLKVKEVYIEEVFAIPECHLSDLCSQFPVIAGVGTIEQPTTITIRV